MIKNYRPHGLQSGFSTLDVMVSIAVIAVLSAGVMMAFRPASNSAKVSRESDTANLIQSKMIAYTNSSANAEGVSNTLAIALGAVSRESVNATRTTSGDGTPSTETQTITNQFGGTTTVRHVATDNMMIEIVNTHLNQQQCIEFAKRLSGNFQSVFVGTTEVKTTTGPINDALLTGVSGCRNADDNTVTVRFNKG